jgi:hypothetical protein
VGKLLHIFAQSDNYRSVESDIFQFMAMTRLKISHLQASLWVLSHKASFWEYQFFFNLAFLLDMKARPIFLPSD